MKQENTVSHPAHYTTGRIEVIDFIQDKELNFALGNVVKYVVRAGRKQQEGMTQRQKQIEDLQKARQYLDFEIRRLKQEDGQ